MLDTEKFFQVSSLASLVNIPSQHDYEKNGWTDLHEIFGRWDDLITVWVNSEKPCDANFFQQH